MCDKFCIQFGEQNLQENMIAGKRVLEIGAQDINGSLKPHVIKFKPKCYIGLDQQAGRNVDLIYDINKLDDIFDTEYFDLIICTETLEHIKEWQKCILNIMKLLKIGGWLLLTTRSIGFHLHGYPFDYWRFQVEDMRKIFINFDNLKIEPDSRKLGVFVLAKMPKVFDSRNFNNLPIYHVISRKGLLPAQIDEIKNEVKPKNIIEIILQYECRKIAEIGVLRGDNAARILNETGDCIKECYLVDPWRSYNQLKQQNSDDKRLLEYDQKQWDDLAFHAHRLMLTNDKIRVLRLQSGLAARMFPNNYLDFVYIDADHSFSSVIKDIGAWVPKIKPDGVIAGHDYSSGWQGVIRAVNLVFGNKFERLSGGVWFVKMDGESRRGFIKNAKVDDICK